MRWGTGAGFAGGYQPQQQQDAGDQGCQGGHGVLYEIGGMSDSLLPLGDLEGD